MQELSNSGRPSLGAIAPMVKPEMELENESLKGLSKSLGDLSMRDPNEEEKLPAPSQEESEGDVRSLRDLNNHLDSS